MRFAANPRAPRPSTTAALAARRLFPSAIASLVNPGSETLPGPLGNRVLWVTIATVLVAPLAFRRTLDSLRFTSTLGVCFVVYG